MIWPAMVFNLCVGLLFAGYLLRAVRRFERRADSVMFEMDRRHEERMSWLESVRLEAKTAMREQVDKIIAEMEASAQLFPVAAEANAITHSLNGTNCHSSQSHTAETVE